jgi:NADPH:quinone reductase-like Zn-dependent oxidoreductase
MGPGVLLCPPKALTSSRGQQLTPGIREGRCHMKAFVVDKYGKGSTLRARQMPEPETGDHDALVRIAAAGVNPLDAKIMAGEFRLVLPYKPPFVLGNDLAGVVERAGPGVHRFAPGDEVYARPDKDRIGTFAGLISVSEDDLAPKPAGLTMAQAASLPLVALTAWQALVERADVKPGQKVLIHAGSGGVGTIAIQLAKYLGAYMATTTSTANVEWVRRRPGGRLPQAGLRAGCAGL